MPASHDRIVAAHAFADLYQRMLDVAGMLLVLQILGDSVVGELASEPGVPPEQEGHEDNQPCRHEKQETIPRGHARPRGLRRRITGDDIRRIACLRRGCWACHVSTWFLTLFGRRRWLR